MSLLKNKSHKIGATFYILWGIIHVGIGATSLYSLSTSGSRAVLLMMGSILPPEEIPQIIPNVVSGLVAQHSWNLIWFGLFAIIVGTLLNWKNSKTGYWFNVALVSATEIGVVISLAVTGYITLFPIFMGLTFGIIAVIFSTIGRLQAPGENI